MGTLGNSTESTRRDQGAVRPVVVGEGAATRPTGEVAFARLHCSMCHKRFVLDLDGEWDAPPPDIEVEGRAFLGIDADAALCHRCLHSVQVAGAERMYWRLAHC
ncbi:MAG: hypothetical protein P1P84_12760 [Deferrisomatales bacterium]|nr:hypothetical protein [Deferrisomatales bacterium]